MQPARSLALVAVLSLSASAFAQTRDVAKILENRALFGPDIGAVVRVLPALAAAGEPRIQLFPDRIIGDRKYANVEEATRVASAVNERSRDQNVIPPFAAMTFIDDQKIHVATVAKDAHFLAPRLRMDVVVRELGPPEKTGQLIIDSGHEFRPVILDLAVYAGGAVIFATKQGTADPKAINRVFLATRF